VRSLAAEVATPAQIADACRDASDAFDRLVGLAGAHRAATVAA